MNVVVSGLSPREEMAFGMFLGKAMKDWSWRSVPSGRDVELPAADLLVADLVALGLANWSEAAEAQLLRLLQGSPAVLLVPAHDQSWASQSRVAVQSPAIVWLKKPYGTEEMFAALRKAGAVRMSMAKAPTPPSKPAPGTGLAAKPVAISEAVDRGSQSKPGSPVRSGGDPVRVRFHAFQADDDVPSLNGAQLQARLDAIPGAGGHVFLRQLSTMLSAGQPFEARFTFQHSMIVHPGDDWVASNTPMTVIERVCQSDALASVVSMRTMDTADAEVRAQRLGMPVRELETFLWELAAVTLDGKPSQSSG